MIKVVNMRTYCGYYRYVGRPTKYGNPFQLDGQEDREKVIIDFAAYWYAPEQKRLRQIALQEIKLDDTLGCYCAPMLCHADIIAGYVEWRRK